MWFVRKNIVSKTIFEYHKRVELDFNVRRNRVFLLHFEVCLEFDVSANESQSKPTKRLKSEFEYSVIHNRRAKTWSESGTRDSVGTGLRRKIKFSLLNTLTQIVFHFRRNWMLIGFKWVFSALTSGLTVWWTKGGNRTHDRPFSDFHCFIDRSKS